MDLAVKNEAVDTEEMSKRIYCDGWDDDGRWCQWSGLSSLDPPVLAFSSCIKQDSVLAMVPS